MKKKTRYRSSSSLLLPFILAILVCCAGAALNFYFFYKSVNRSLSKMNEKPIATITFKYKTAERKFLDRMVWDRLRQTSPLYNGDIIRTEHLSEAIINFFDGNIMELAEDTMVQVFVNDNDSVSAQLAQGSASVDSMDSKNGMRLFADGSDVFIESGSSVAAGMDGVQVLQGNAVVTSDGQIVNVGEGDALALKNSGDNLHVLVSSPRPSSKILYFTPSDKEVLFAWKMAGSVSEAVNGGTALKLQVSSDRNFASSAYEEKIDCSSIPTSGLSGSSNVSLDDGIYYWRIADAKGKTYVQNRFLFAHSYAPELLSPAEDYAYTFRSKLPSVRFIWKESAHASSYRLEVSSDKNFSTHEIDERTSLNSRQISTLKEGTWFWRVTPFYSVNRIGLAAPGEVKSFKIEKTGALEKPLLLVPQNGAIIDNGDAASKVSFSWKANREAAKYTLVIARNEALTQEAKTITVTKNFHLLPKEEKLDDGKWFWAVKVADSEGAESPLSEVRPFFAMKGNREQHVVEPADNYGIAQNLLPDMNFTWKRNLPDYFVTEVQISRDANFGSIVYTGQSANNVLQVTNLALGKYYWRLSSSGGGNTMTTQPRMFEVLDSLDESAMIDPKNGGKAVAREGKLYTVKWAPVEHADYYKVEIFSQATGESIFRDIVYGTQLDLNMYSGPGFVDRSNYNVEIQAFSNAIPGIVSRRTGRLLRASFLLAKLHPVAVVSPLKGSEIDGLEALMNPPYAKWESVDENSYAQLVLTRTDVDPPVEVMKVPTDEQMAAGNRVAPFSVRLAPEDGLHSGTYEIVVYAETLDGIDVSGTDEKYKGRFTVLPVPPLDNPERMKTSPEQFNRDYLRKKKNKREIEFSWKSVKNANDYKFSIRDADGNVLVEKYLGDQTEYILDFVTMDDKLKNALIRGQFTWCIKALRRIDSNKDGKLDVIFQESPDVPSILITDVPEPKDLKINPVENTYGKAKK
ncbi:MAG: hypothetical protein J6X11_12495 [Treponema sp.]|nr:hypothetical protein [Treponema sp.]